MSIVRIFRNGSVALVFVVFVICVYLLGQVEGFQYGYFGAHNVDLSAPPTIQVAVHGYNVIDPIRFGYIVGCICCIGIVLTYCDDSTLRGCGIIAIGIALIAIGNGTYNKYLVLGQGTSNGFVNPHKFWIQQTVFFDWLCIGFLAGVLIYQCLTEFWNSLSKAEVRETLQK